MLLPFVPCRRAEPLIPCISLHYDEVPKSIAEAIIEKELKGL